MKNKSSTKKNFDKFSKRNTHKRKSKERAKNELLRAVAETNVGTDSLVIKDSLDRGRGGRVSRRAGRDEICAEGIFSASKSGFGFVAAEGEARDIFIPEDKTLGALEGDKVEIIYHKYISSRGEEKTEGRVRRILVPAKKTVIGTVECRSIYKRGSGHLRRVKVLVPDDAKTDYFLLSDGDKYAEGEKLQASIRRGDGNTEHSCVPIKSFGDTRSREANYEAILAEYEIPTEFSSAELCEAEFFASRPLTDEGRVRIRETVFTIDGEGAKDLDDAISLRRLKDGWQLGVHIADVSTYIPERSHLDRAVMARGTSVYFADKVVPMLPRALSNGACSLNPGEDKYTLSAVISLNGCGDIQSVRLIPAVICSKLRGVYSEVNKIFDGTAGSDIKAKYRSVIPTLEKMHELYRLLSEKSVKRGSVELESSEAEIILGADGTPEEIVRRERGDAEKMIEQFMLCANEAVARFLSENEIPCVYRIHEQPPAEKLSELMLYAHNLGLKTSGVSRDNPHPCEFSALLNQAREKGLISQISNTMLRSMAKARYSEQRSPHFGLSLDYYCHFTSPIRRLADLATHRIIHKVLLEGKRSEAYSKYARRAAAAATEAELRAVGAERRIENLYKVIFMQDRVGETFDAVISSVTSFGFFAELENTCEGLVPVSELFGVFTYDEKTLSLRSRDITYRIGDRVSVRLEEADIIRGKLRFSVADTEADFAFANKAGGRNGK